MNVLNPEVGEALERTSVPADPPPGRRSNVRFKLVPIKALVVRIRVAFLPSWRPKVVRKRPAPCCTVTEALPSPLEIARKLMALVMPVPTEDPILVMSWAEPRSLVMRTSSAEPGGKDPFQLPLLFQSNVPPAVFDQRDSANPLWVHVTMKRMDATRIVNLARIVTISRLLTLFPMTFGARTPKPIYSLLKFIA